MGNFSRNTFDRLKHYVGVRLQQGVPLVDADWNEMEDIRKHELQTFLKWFVGNGVPQGNDGFRIIPHSGGAENDFTIKGGINGEPGYCLVDGWDAMIEQDINYTQQPLYNNDTLAEEWGVEPLRPLTPPPIKGDRTDTVYLDVWEREVGRNEDENLVNPKIGIETCVRIKREWVVRVAEGGIEPPAPFDGHVYYPVASINREAGPIPISEQDIRDLRQTGLTLHSIKEYIDADGTITSAKIRNADNTSGQDTSQGDGIKTDHIQDRAVTTGKIADIAVTNAKLRGGSVSDDKLSTTTRAKLVTNGNSHDHSGGDGGIINHSSLNKDDGPNPHGTTADHVNALPITGGSVNGNLTVNGSVGIGKDDPQSRLDVDGEISGKSYRNVSQSFFVGGDGDKFYAVAFRDDDWGQGPTEFQVSRPNVHEDRLSWGSMILRICWHASNWGHGANFVEQLYNFSTQPFLKQIIEYPYSPYLLVWLRGNTTYHYRSVYNRVVLHEILGTNNQTCSFDPVGYPGLNTAINCTCRPGGCIPPGTSISGDFYVNGKSHAARRTGTGIDYAEYFESKNGKQIKPGTAVTLDGGKIKPAKKGGIPLGIISANPLIAGGMPLEWPKKYLRDEFGNQIMEEYKEEIMVPKKEKIKKERQKMEKKKVKEKVVRTEAAKIKGKYCQKEVTETIKREMDEPVFDEVDLYDAAGKNKIGKHKIPVMETYEEEIDVLDRNGKPVMVGTGTFETKTRPKMNPEYDEKREYIPREKRPEWNCVGLLGQLPLRKGQPVTPTWIKIKDISKDVELWLVK